MENHDSQLKEEIKESKAELVKLLYLISKQKKQCDEIEDETRYMKEYAESFISTGYMSKK
ncbi:hypothetical protein DAPK24_035450 [Pichia kluyveri]|uniref:Uncharacterized protein n=1 Tax=Pichia kluyveri TaxID=36015 RepID=A0AAV5R6M8_PICKL|nr:hypothetical protein DAPK24_035450 [Pichia kluyveri]